MRTCESRYYLQEFERILSVTGLSGSGEGPLIVVHTDDIE